MLSLTLCFALVGKHVVPPQYTQSNGLNQLLDFVQIVMILKIVDFPCASFPNPQPKRSSDAETRSIKPACMSAGPQWPR